MKATVLFLVRTAVTKRDLLQPYINFRVIFSVSLKTETMLLIGITLTIYCFVWTLDNVNSFI